MPETVVGLVVVEGRSKGRVVVSGVLPAPAGKQIGLVGDTHANAVWTASVVRALGAEGVDVVVQLGDFGWWPQKGFAKYVSTAAAVAGVTVPG